MYYIDRLSTYFDINCPLYQDDFLGNIFVLFSYAPAFVSYFLLGVSFVRKEVYFFLLGIITFIDTNGINAGLQAAFNSPPPFPGCGRNDKGMPATASEAAYILYALLFTFPLFYRRSLSLYHALLAAVIVSLLQISEMGLGLATPQQALAGAFVGTFVGIAWQFLIHLIVYPFYRGFTKVRVCFNGYELLRCWNWLCREYDDERQTRIDEENRLMQCIEQGAVAASTAVAAVDSGSISRKKRKKRKKPMREAAADQNSKLPIYMRFGPFTFEGVERGTGDRNWKPVKKPLTIVNIHKLTIQQQKSKK
jgi:membrane-associated phospholipid phosphatase